MDDLVNFAAPMADFSQPITVCVDDLEGEIEKNLLSLEQLIEQGKSDLQLVRQEVSQQSAAIMSNFTQ